MFLCGWLVRTLGLGYVEWGWFSFDKGGREGRVPIYGHDFWVERVGGGMGFALVPDRPSV